MSLSIGTNFSTAALSTNNAVKSTASEEAKETPAMEQAESASEKALELNKEGTLGTRVNTTA